MNILLFFVAGFLSFNSWANLHLAPGDFETDQGRAVFVDFLSAHYSLTYDLARMKTSVKSKITFRATSRGRPVFDLVADPKNIKLNGQATTQRMITFPGEISKLRQLDTEVEAGIHVLEMENSFKTNVLYRPVTKSVSSAFWIRDLKERKFLEQYVPSNFEYDQYKMILEVNFTGAKKVRQDIYTNGEVKKLSSKSYRIEFPDYFTVSCPYFHTTPQGRMARIDFSYKSISGRLIPITVYSPFKSRTQRFRDETIRVMAELEWDYGPWPHPGFLAYGTLPGTGGMEHSGATQTSFGALDHEMLHSYFAKGIMPANGASGWIDEALASWRDRGYPRLTHPGFEGSKIGGHSPYQRHTDSDSYGLGSSFMAYLDWRLDQVGGLKAFLKGYFAAYKHQVITTEHFKNNLEFFSGLNLDEEFATYIYGEHLQDNPQALAHEEHPVHKQLTPSQLMDLL
jgi:hypothetical protein